MKATRLFSYINLLLILILIPTACSMGPSYSIPEIPVPENWHNQIQEDGENFVDENVLWWESLNDPILNFLIEQAAGQNLDLYIASMRILEARLLEKGASASNYFPHLDGSITYGHAQFNQSTLNNLLGNCSSRGGTRQIDLFEAGFDAEWEIDLFGMRAHQVEALKAAREATEEEFRQLWITLSAEIGKNYIELRSLQQQLQILECDISSQKENLKLVEGLTSAGFSSIIDQMQAQEQYSILSSQRPLLELSIKKAIYRLSILLGYSPAELFCDLSQPSVLPLLPCNIGVGLPSGLLRRRPDIRKAERDLAAATEMVGSAVAALFPRLSLYGFLGDITTACSKPSFTWFAGPQLLLPIFNSRLLKEEVFLNKIKNQEAFYNYQKVVLEALEETENAIAALNAEQERYDLLKQAVKSSEETFNLTMQLYEKGFKNYIEVIVTQRSYLAAKNQLLISQGQLLLHYISLYKSVGGGWINFDCEGTQ